MRNPHEEIPVNRPGARVLHGDLTGISATVLDRDLETMRKIRTIEITFRYEPRK